MRSITRSKYSVFFSEIPDGKSFYYKGFHCIKMRAKDLQRHDIKTVNAICAINGELLSLEPETEVHNATIVCNKNFDMKNYEGDIPEIIKRLTIR